MTRPVEEWREERKYVVPDGQRDLSKQLQYGVVGRHFGVAERYVESELAIHLHLWIRQPRQVRFGKYCVVTKGTKDDRVGDGYLGRHLKGDASAKGVALGGAERGPFVDRADEAQFPVAVQTGQFVQGAQADRGFAPVVVLQRLNRGLRQGMECGDFSEAAHAARLPRFLVELKVVAGLYGDRERGPTWWAIPGERPRQMIKSRPEILENVTHQQAPSVRDRNDHASGPAVLARLRIDVAGNRVGTTTEVLTHLVFKGYEMFMRPIDLQTETWWGHD